MTAAVLKVLPVVLALGGGVGGDVLASNKTTTAPAQPHWIEVKWPFPIDQWGTGRAFQCGADSCGVTLNLYLRPKIGFCNCARGVYDDTELDRVGDIELLGPQFVGIDQGQPVTVGWMQGRSRTFTIAGPFQAPSTALAIAFNDKCDVVVATVTAADPSGARRATLQFLNTDLVLRWARAELGSDGS